MQDSNSQIIDIFYKGENGIIQKKKDSFDKLNVGLWYSTHYKKYLEKKSPALIGKTYKFKLDNSEIKITSIEVQLPKWKNEKHSELSYGFVYFKFLNCRNPDKIEHTFLCSFWNGSWLLKL